MRRSCPCVNERKPTNTTSVSEKNESGTKGRISRASVGSSALSASPCAARNSRYATYARCKRRDGESVRPSADAPSAARAADRTSGGTSSRNSSRISCPRSRMTPERPAVRAWSPAIPERMRRRTSQWSGGSICPFGERMPSGVRPAENDSSRRQSFHVQRRRRTASSGAAERSRRSRRRRRSSLPGMETMLVDGSIFRRSSSISETRRYRRMRTPMRGTAPRYFGPIVSAGPRACSRAFAKSGRSAGFRLVISRPQTTTGSSTHSAPARIISSRTLA